MSYSDIIGSISGLLQFAVAAYAFRVSRLFGMTRVGWLFCSAFSILAMMHVLLSVRLFGVNFQLGPVVNFSYEVISILLLGTIAQVEILVRRHQRTSAETRQAQSDSEVKLNAELLEVKKTRDELRLTVTRLQSELDQQKQAREEIQKVHQEEMAALRQAEEESLASLGGARAELDQFKRNQELAVSRHMEEMAASRQIEEELRVNVAALRTEIEQEKQLREQIEAAYQDQLASSGESERELQQSFSVSESRTNHIASNENELQVKLAAACASEQEWRETAARLQEEAFRHKAMRDKVEEASRDLLQTLRQSGIHEIATMAQARVAYIGRLANLLRNNAKTLRKFITGTPRGRQLPFSLALLVEHLSDEQFLLLKRIESVQNKTRVLQANVASNQTLMPEIASPEPSTISSDLAVSEPVSPEAVDNAFPTENPSAGRVSQATALNSGSDLRTGDDEAFVPDPDLLQASRQQGLDRHEFVADR